MNDEINTWTVVKTIGWFFLIIIVLNIIGVGLGVVGWGFGFLGNSREVARKEFYPDALLKKSIVATFASNLTSLKYSCFERKWMV